MVFFFEVAKNPDHPFIVTTENTETKVLGTAFNIFEDSLATTITVNHGKVAFTAGTQQLELEKDQAAAFNNSTNQLEKVKVDLNYLSWKTKKLSFENTPLFKVVGDLKAFYKLDIDIDQNVQVSDYSMTTVFDNQSIDDVMLEMSLVLNLHISKKNKTIHIHLK